MSIQLNAVTSLLLFTFSSVTMAGMLLQPEKTATTTSEKQVYTATLAIEDRQQPSPKVVHQPISQSKKDRSDKIEKQQNKNNGLQDLANLPPIGGM